MIGKKPLTPEPANPRLAALPNVAFLALLAWLLLTAAYRGAINPTDGIMGVDFGTFYSAAHRLNEGLSLYRPNGEHYVYSPLLAELMRPLAHLTYFTALKAWFFVNTASLLLSAALYANAARLTWRDAASLGLILLVGFRFWPSTMNFGLGQVNLVLLALVAGMYWADSRKKMFLFALLIALAALVKVWMLGLVLALLLRRQWKPVAVSIGGFIVGMAALFSIVGWHQWPLFLHADAASAGQIIVGRPPESITGFAQTHFRANPFVQPLVNSAVVADLFLLGCGVAIAAAFILLWRLGPDGSPYENRLRFGLIIVTVLLLLPTFEGEYVVYCLPLLWTLLLPGGADLRPSWVFPASLLIYLVFTRGWPIYMPVAPINQHGLRSLLVSMDFFNLSALWLVTLCALRNRGRHLPGPQRHNAVPAEGLVS